MHKVNNLHDVLSIIRDKLQYKCNAIEHGSAALAGPNLWLKLEVARSSKSNSIVIACGNSTSKNEATAFYDSKVNFPWTAIQPDGDVYEFSTDSISNIGIYDYRCIHTIPLKNDSSLSALSLKKPVDLNQEIVPIVRGYIVYSQAPGAKYIHVSNKGGILTLSFVFERKDKTILIRGIGGILIVVSKDEPDLILTGNANGKFIPA